MSMTAAASSLVALLRGDAGAIENLDAHPAEIVLATAAREGLTSLAAERLSGRDPQPIAYSALVERAQRDALQDVLRHASLTQLLATLDHEGVTALVFKGEQLAHLCYERPDLRPRLDTDILVKPGDRGRARQVLQRCGYEPAAQLEADLISYQQSFVRRPGTGGTHVVDLHWRISNPHDFAGAISTEELYVDTVPIPALGPAARGPNLMHALLIALIHPVAHHRGVDRLLWDLDTARLAARVSPAMWARFVELAGARGLGQLCRARLARAVDLFGAPVPADVMATLARSESTTRQTIHVDRHTTQAWTVVASVLALPKWSDRAALIRQHLLPPQKYMREIYAPASRSPLAVLYMRRAMLGFLKYCRRPQ